MSIETEWEEHPITKDLLKELEENIESIKDAWSNGSFETVETNQRALGNIAALEEVVYYIKSVGRAE